MMRGATPLCTPRSGGLRSPRPPWVGLPGPHPGFLSFHDERNQRRARGAAPGPRWGAIIIPPAAASAAPPRKGCLFGWHANHKPPAAPRIDSRKCFSDGTKGKNKTDLLTNSKWQIGLFLWHKPYRGGAGTAGGAKRPPQGIPKGAALGAPLVTFPATGKSPGVEGRSALPHGGCGGGAPTLGSAEGAPAPSHIGVARGLHPLAKKPLAFCRKI